MTRDQDPSVMLNCRHSRRCDEQQGCHGKRCESRVAAEKPTDAEIKEKERECVRYAARDANQAGGRA